MDDIIKRHFTKQSADTVWATPDGGISASNPASEEGFWLDMYHNEVNRCFIFEAEIERLRTRVDELDQENEHLARQVAAHG